MARSLAIVLHFLEETTVLTPETVVLTLNGVKFEAHLSQLILRLATDFVRILKTLDIFRR